MLESLKFLVPLLSGGFAGALFKAWWDSRNSKLQKIPLIERVNRLVNPEIKGFTLARVTGNPEDRHLEEIKNVREYQFTLRNTSSIHLQEVEVQFEFPVVDVEGRAERPALSKTPPIATEATVADPWKSAYRWRIPHLPSGDSIEFTFRAVDLLIRPPMTMR